MKMRKGQTCVENLEKLQLFLSNSIETQDENVLLNADQLKSHLQALAEAISYFQSDTDPAHRLSLDSSTDSSSSIGIPNSTSNSSRHSSLDTQYSNACKGFLRLRLFSKIGRMKTWYCLLHGAHLFWYWDKQSALENKNLVSRVRIVDVQEWDGKNTLVHYDHGFLFETKTGMIYCCSAPNASEKDKWISEMMKGMEAFAARMQPVASRQTELKVLDENTEIKKTNRVNNSTVGGLIAGAAIGSVVPVFGTITGGVVGGMLGNVIGKKKRKDRLNAIKARRISYRELRMKDSSCYTCAAPFRIINRHHRYCKSCYNAFCRAHCSKKTVLPQTGEACRVRVCDSCFQRQEFINFIFVATTVMMEQMNRNLCQYDSLGSESEFNKQTIDAIDEIKQVISTGPRFDCLSLLAILYKCHSDSVAFSVGVCQLAILAELDLEQIDFFWAQLIGLFLTLCQIPTSSHSNSCFSNQQIFFYVSIIVGICQRSHHLALSAVWQLSAMLDDCIAIHNHNAAHYTMAFLWILCSQVREELEVSTIVTELCIDGSPELQSEAMMDAMHEFLICIRNLSNLHPDIPIANWLIASTKTELLLSKAILLHASKTPDKLMELYSPIETEFKVNWYQGQAMSILEKLNQTSVIDDCQDPEDVTAFEDEAFFVSNITDIAERLRLVTPVSERKNHLPGLLSALQESSLLNPTCASNLYMPLCGAVDHKLRILRVLTDKGTVFSTRARAPTLIIFEVIKEKRSVSTSYDYLRALEKEKFFNLSFSKMRSIDQSHAVLTDFINSSPSSVQEVDSFKKQTCNPENRPESLLVQDAQQLYESHMNINGIEDEKIGDRGTCHIKSWEEKKLEFKNVSEYGGMIGWDAISVIAKSFDDMRQEVFTLQLIMQFKIIFESVENLPLYLRHYKIVCTGPNIGLIETLNDTMSLDSIKKDFGSLYDYFLRMFGDPENQNFKSAQSNFIESMAAYSLVSYFLQIKDRHNGNIMMDQLGHVIHIDFGFLLGIAPGGSFSLEDAPFKLTAEMVNLMNEANPDGFNRFKDLFVQGFIVARENYSRILSLVKLSMKDSPFPCFVYPSRVLRDLRKRFFIDVPLEDAKESALQLILTSENHWGTRKYDQFQEFSNGIKP